MSCFLDVASVFTDLGVQRRELFQSKLESLKHKEKTSFAQWKGKKRMNKTLAVVTAIVGGAGLFFLFCIKNM